jgi:hypothetical protein
MNLENEDSSMIHELTHEDTHEVIHEARCWRDKGWTAQVIKNDEEGWAVAMYKDGQAEPALVGPWTMGRDKKNPKPLDVNAFNTLIKTASEVIRRHEQQLHADLHKQLRVFSEHGDFTIHLDITPDEDDPYATLSAVDETGEQVAAIKVAPNLKLTRALALTWIENGFPRRA